MSLVMILLLLLSVPVLGAELPQILQPNTTAYSKAEVATLTEEITTLKQALSDTRLGSKHRFSANEWQTRNFAEYTAGSLAEMGYATQLASQAGWPDGVHTWVLVGLPLAAKTAWTPVEPTPGPNETQQNLGYVPSYSDSGGNLWFEAKYLNFSEVEALPRNLPPVAKMRPPSSITVSETEKFVALGAYDPDGEIVLFLWTPGDGTTSVGTSPTYRHTYRRTGDYTLTLTVIDNLGKRATTSVDVGVEPWKPRPEEAEDCGCGK